MTQLCRAAKVLSGDKSLTSLPKMLKSKKPLRLGADTDIIVASAKAYLHALNLIEKPLDKQHPQKSEGI